MSTNDYDNKYNELEKAFREEAKSLIKDEKADEIMKEQQILFDNAKTNNIPVNSLIGNNTLSYAKNLLRKNQPFYPVYALLYFLTEFAYIMLFWVILVCTSHYVTGNHNAFSQPLKLSLSPFVIGIILLCSELIKIHTAKKLASANNMQNAYFKKELKTYKICAYFISAVLIFIFAFILYETGYFLNLFQITLFEMFLFTVAMLLLSGIHNVIYSSHFIPFFEIGIFTLLRKKENAETALKEYTEMSFLQYNASGNKPTEEFISALKTRMASYRTYCILALFICVVLFIVCIYQMIVSPLTIGIIIFTILVVIVSALFLAATISCQKIVK